MTWIVLATVKMSRIKIRSIIIHDDFLFLLKSETKRITTSVPGYTYKVHFEFGCMKNVYNNVKCEQFSMHGLIMINLIYSVIL